MLSCRTDLAFSLYLYCGNAGETVDERENLEKRKRATATITRRSRIEQNKKKVDCEGVVMTGINAEKFGTGASSRSAVAGCHDS